MGFEPVNRKEGIKLPSVPAPPQQVPWNAPWNRHISITDAIILDIFNSIYM